MKTKTEKTVVRTVLEDLMGDVIPTKSKLHLFRLVQVTAPVWDTCLFLVRFILTLYCVVEFPIRWAFSARLRRQRKEFRQRLENENRRPPASPGFQRSPVVGKWLAGLTDLHRKYVAGKLDVEYESVLIRRTWAEEFAKAFEVALEEDCTLETLVKRVEEKMLAACTYVREVEKKRFTHLTNATLDVARNRAISAIKVHSVATGH